MQIRDKRKNEWIKMYEEKSKIALESHQRFYENLASLYWCLGWTTYEDLKNNYY